MSWLSSAANAVTGSSSGGIGKLVGMAAGAMFGGVGGALAGKTISGVLGGASGAGGATNAQPPAIASALGGYSPNTGTGAIMSKTATPAAGIADAVDIGGLTSNAQVTDNPDIADALNQLAVLTGRNTEQEWNDLINLTKGIENG